MDKNHKTAGEVKYRNRMQLEFDARPENEGFARVAVASFLAVLDPTMEEMEDVKTAVSEAVTNAIIHGYGNIENEDTEDKVIIHAELENRRIMVQVIDYGAGIEDVAKAMEPMYTTRPELDRSGMGFAFMEAFMDELDVNSTPGEGTTIVMARAIHME